MFGKLFALYAPEDGGEAGDGAAGGGSPEGGQGKKPEDGDVVPKTQFIAAINSANAKYNALEAKFNELVAKVEAKPAEIEQPKEYTRAELNAMVEARTITQDQADAQMDAQAARRAEAAATRVATETVTSAQRKERVDTEIARYTAVAPEILDDAHETRQAIKTEYQYLIGLGDKPSVETQLKAIRSVLGPVEKLERARNGKSDHVSHREDGGGGGEGGGRKAKDGPLTYDDLSQREKAHYDKGLQSGRYKDKAEINAELKFANSRTRTKYGARA